MTDRMPEPRTQITIGSGGKRTLIIDGDGSHYTPEGSPCSLCNDRQHVDDMPPKVWVRVREKADDGTRVIGYVCPNCVARLFLQVTRLGLWKQVSGQLMAAIRRAIEAAMGKTKESRRLGA